MKNQIQRRILYVLSTAALLLATGCNSHYLENQSPKHQSSEEMAARRSAEDELRADQEMTDLGLLPRRQTLGGFKIPGVMPSPGPVPELPFTSGGASFDVRKMVASLEQQMVDADVIGFAYAIALNGKLLVSGGEGWARAPWQAPPPAQTEPMMETSRVHLASVSKPLTAIAVMHLIENSNTVTLDSPFYPLIETEFPNAGSGVENITIRQLLHHTSGLDKAISAYCGGDKLPDLLAGGASGTPFVYNNANYCYLRKVVEHVSGEDYIDYVEANILQQMGIQDMSCNADEALTTLYYAAGTENQGVLFDDFSNRCAAYGWYASARELAQLMAHYRFDTVLSKQTREQMLSDCIRTPQGGLVCLGLWKTTGERGVYYKHGGSWTIGGGGSRTAVMGFDVNIDAGLVVNSTGVDADSLLKRAYDAAYK